MEHSKDNFHNRTVLPFRHTILLRSLGCSGLPLNASLFAKVMKLIGFIFSPIISPYGLDLFFGLVIDQGFEVSKPGEHFILLFQEEYPSLARIIIYKSEVI